MKHYPKITIITPSFNQGQYIEQTITSILNQNYPNLEYIIIDGGSTDNTVDIIKKYEDKISYWVSEPDNGQAQAINKGIIRARSSEFGVQSSEFRVQNSEFRDQSSKFGDLHLINWINSDDYLEPDALHTLAKAATENPKGLAFCGYTRCFWDKDNLTSHRYRMGIKKNVTDTILNIKMNQPGTFYNMTSINKLFPINESLRYVFDNELWMRYLCMYGQKNIVLLNQTLAHFRQHGNSKSFGEGFDAFNQEQQNILQQLCNQTKLHDLLQNYVDRDTKNNNYKCKNWDITHLDIKKFHGWFANKYMTTLFNDGYKEDSRLALKMALQSGYIKFDRKTLGLVQKLILS